MEFHKKLQELRKQKGLTQEELAELLYVSRAAVSKWESGRGYPNIDSLKAIASCFSVTVDDLLSSNEVLTIAEEENKKKEQHVRDMVFGLLDCGIALLLFLPFFGQKAGGIIDEVSLLSLTGVEPYLKTAYFVVLIAIILTGILTLALQSCNQAVWLENKSRTSLILNAIGTLLFIVSLQPYAAVLLFMFLAIKVLILTKTR